MITDRSRKVQSGPISQTTRTANRLRDLIGAENSEQLSKVRAEAQTVRGEHPCRTRPPVSQCSPPSYGNHHGLGSGNSPSIQAQAAASTEVRKPND